MILLLQDSIVIGTVIDEDDNGPVFANTKSTNCTISGYSANSYREYTVRNSNDNIDSSKVKQ